MAIKFYPGLEQRLLAMVQDEQLDPYNRLLFAYRFNNYAHNLSEEAHAIVWCSFLESRSSLRAYFFRFF